MCHPQLTFVRKNIYFNTRESIFQSTPKRIDFVVIVVRMGLGNGV
jgi:hypothetical protein